LDCHRSLHKKKTRTELPGQAIHVSSPRTKQAHRAKQKYNIANKAAGQDLFAGL
jgi:hypothetical protein